MITVFSGSVAIYASHFRLWGEETRGHELGWRAVATPIRPPRTLPFVCLASATHCSGVCNFAQTRFQPMGET
jgi:hypothetical protein